MSENEEEYECLESMEEDIISDQPDTNKKIKQNYIEKLIQEAHKEIKNNKRNDHKNLEERE